MKKFRLIYYITFFVFLLISLFFIGYHDFIVNRYGTIGLVNCFKYWILAGMIMVAVILLVESIHNKRLKNKMANLEKENYTLKARLYDKVEPHKDIDTESYEA